MWWSVGTSIRGDRNGPARKVRHDPGLPDLNQCGSRADTTAGTCDRIVELADREMGMSVAYESVRARCMAIQVNERGFGDAMRTASDQHPLLRTPPVHGHVSERRRSGG